VSRVPECRGDGLNLLRSVRGGIDHGVEGSAAERPQFTVAVAPQLLDLREEVWVLPPAVEKRHFMSSGERGFDDVTANENGSTEDQDLHVTRRLSSQGRPYRGSTSSVGAVASGSTVQPSYDALMAMPAGERREALRTMDQTTRLMLFRTHIDRWLSRIELA
jgi:hypothetical protein